MEEQKQESTTPVIPKGFKGLSKDMKATKGSPNSDEVFEIGKIYYKDNIENPALCSKDGYHFCAKLEDVFTFYQNDGKNRFFEIEVLGNTNSDRKKSITTAFRLTREISQEEIKSKQEAKDKELQKEQFLLGMKFKEVKYLQEKYPTMIVGGSFALIMHGVTANISRLSKGSVGDLDLIIPYYQLIKGDKEFEICVEDEEEMSGDDYEACLTINGIKADIRVDPKQRYEEIKFNDFTFKVAKLEDILLAKLKYAKQGNKKHLDDVYDMVGKDVDVKTVSQFNPFEFL